MEMSLLKIMRLLFITAIEEKQYFKKAQYIDRNWLTKLCYFYRVKYCT